MTTIIPDAYRYLNAAKLANRDGTSPSIPTVLDSNATSVLDVGRSQLLSVKGIGISPQSRALNKSFLDQAKNYGNQLLSLGIGASATIEGLQQQILAIRASLPVSQISQTLIDEAKAKADAQSQGTSAPGSQVDTTA